MATGGSGVSGAHVQRVANKENNQEHVNVIHQLQNMEETNVMATPRKVKFVTRTYPARVSNKCSQTGNFPRYLVLMFQNETSYENEFGLHENEPLVATRFHMNGFAQRLVLTQRQKATRKWSIYYFIFAYLYNS